MISNPPFRTQAFSGFSLRTGCLYDYSKNEHPTILYGWADGGSLSLSGEEKANTFFGYVYRGPAKVEAEHNSYQLVTGQYFCLAESLNISGGGGIVICSLAYRGQNLIGGPIEPVGRLRYIDGCTDSLLVAPTKMGDPCLNALYFPTGIDQTSHTHPSMRVGLVADGGGECITPDGREDLVPGMAFIIHQDGIHKFRTGTERGMVVIAYHPDSDFGPQDENHPMINRTMVAGVSAAHIPGIHTRTPEPDTAGGAVNQQK